MHFSSKDTRRHTWAKVMALVLGLLLSGYSISDGTVVAGLPALANMTPQTTEGTEKDEEPGFVIEAEELVEIGLAKIDSGEYEDALVEFDQALKLDPNSAGAYYGRALAIGSQGDVMAAMADIERALALQPDNIDFLELRGDLRRFSDDLPGAVEDLSAAMDILDAEGTVDSYYSVYLPLKRGHTYLQLGEIELGLADYARAAHANPFLTDLYGEYKRLSYSQQQVEQISVELEEFAAASDSPGSEPYVDGMKLLLRAQLTDMPDAYSGAIEAFDAAIDADETLAEALHARGVARLGASTIEGLSGSYSIGSEEVTYTDPQTGESVTISREEYDADIELQEQMLQAERAMAIADLRAAVDADPDNATYVYDLGAALFGQQEELFGSVYVTPIEENRDEALAMLEKAVKLDPEWEQARLSAAVASAYWGNEDSIRALNAINTGVKDIIISEDGNRAKILRTDHSVDIWDLSVNKLIDKVGPPTTERWIEDSSLSPDGKYMATTSFDGTVTVWDLETMEERLHISGAVDNQHSVHFSPDGSRIATLGNDEVAVYDFASGDVLLTITGSEVAFSGDGALVAVPRDTEDGQIIDIWTLDTGEVTKMSPSIDEYISGMVFTPDDQGMVFVLSNGQGYRWEMESDEMVRWGKADVERHDGLPEIINTHSTELKLNGDGTLMARGRTDGVVVVHDMNSMDEVGRVGESELYSVREMGFAFVPGGNQVISAPSSQMLMISEADTSDDWTSVERMPLPEELTIRETGERLLSTAFEHAETLIENEPSTGWPYWVRALVTIQTSEQSDDGEWDEATQEQLEADYDMFRKLSPDVRLDDVYGEMPAVVQLHNPVPDVPAMTVGRIEIVEDGRRYVQEPMGFQFDFPAQGPTGTSLDTFIPPGMSVVEIEDDFRYFIVYAVDIDLDDRSAEEWFTETAADFGPAEFIREVETPYGTATLLSLWDDGGAVAVLPVDDRVYVFLYSIVSWGDESGSTFASMYGLQIEPVDEVVEELLMSLEVLQ